MKRPSPNLSRLAFVRAVKSEAQGQPFRVYLLRGLSPGISSWVAVGVCKTCSDDIGPFHWNQGECLACRPLDDTRYQCPACDRILDKERPDDEAWEAAVEAGTAITVNGKISPRENCVLYCQECYDTAMEQLNNG